VSIKRSLNRNPIVREAREALEMELAERICLTPIQAEAIREAIETLALSIVAVALQDVENRAAELLREELDRAGP